MKAVMSRNIRLAITLLALNRTLITGVCAVLLIPASLLCTSTAKALDGTQITMAPTDLHNYKPQPKIAIIIDDIGYNRKAGEKAINLPGALTYAVIPFTPFGRTLAEQAFFANKEVMLHLPMESAVRDKLDRGGITTSQSKYQVKEILHDSLNKLPFVVGFNNHMGSRLTTDIKAMTWIMEEVAGTPLFFIDSMTNPHSIAYETANEYGVPSMRRDIFLDADPHPKRIEKAFKRLVRIAKRMGSAIAIAHPYPTTLTFLDKNIATFENHGVTLVNVSELITVNATPYQAKQPAWNAQAILDHLSELPSPTSKRFSFF